MRAIHLDKIMTITGWKADPKNPLLKQPKEESLSKLPPLTQIVARSIEAGIVVPSILRANLEKAGYSVKYYVGPEAEAKEGDHPIGAWVKVFGKDKALVAQAYSHDKSDALLQALYAEVTLGR